MNKRIFGICSIWMFTCAFALKYDNKKLQSVENEALALIGDAKEGSIAIVAPVTAADKESEELLNKSILSVISDTRSIISEERKQLTEGEESGVLDANTIAQHRDLITTLEREMETCFQQIGTAMVKLTIERRLKKMSLLYSWLTENVGENQNITSVQFADNVIWAPSPVILTPLMNELQKKLQSELKSSNEEAIKKKREIVKLRESALNLKGDLKDEKTVEGIQAWMESVMQLLSAILNEFVYRDHNVSSDTLPEWIEAPSIR